MKNAEINSGTRAGVPTEVAAKMGGLQIAPSTYHERVAPRQDPSPLSAPARQDAAFKPEIARVFAQNFAVYGARKGARCRGG